MYHILLRCLILCGLSVGCTLGTTTISPANTSTPTTTSAPSATALPTTPPPTLTPAANVWQPLQPGLDWRSERLPDDASTAITLLRLDPTLWRFRVHYRPGEPLTLTQWQAALPDAAVIVNANFYTPDNTVTGLLVADGVAHGFAYTDRGGTFAVQEDAVVIVSNIAQPYTGQPWDQAIQGFPMLVQGGQQTFFRGDDSTRRSAIAIDARGRVIVLATPGFGLPLSALSAYLAGSDLGVVAAFNLDGGGSTMLAAPEPVRRIPSFDPVPAVLAVYRR